MKSVFAAVLTISLGASGAFAWGPNGHRITGQIGEDHLSAEAKAAVQAIAGERSLALLATWPDFIRSFKVYDCIKPMHFLTVEDDQDINDALQVDPFLSRNCDKDAFERLEMPTNVVAAIDYFSEILAGDADKAANFAELLKAHQAEPLAGSVELSALALVVHFVGDVHQPLHVGRGDDRGGNAISVNWFDEIQNLHWVWDEGLIDQEALTFTEFVMFTEQSFAAEPMPPYGTGPVDWALESVSHRAEIYDVGGNPAFNLPKLSYEYAAKRNALLNERLYFGGIRLADHLNRVFAN